MLRVSPRTRDLIFYSGAVLLLGGGALAYWALQRFDAMPNYQRLAVLLPLAAAEAMLHVDAYRNWSSVDVAARGRAIGALVLPPILLVGTAVWWLAAPESRA
jgi:hypothetical protein